MGSFPTKVKNEMKEMLEGQLKEMDEENEIIVTEKDLEGLPEYVQKYLRFTKSVGKKLPKTVSCSQTGTIRVKNSDEKFSPFLGTELYTINPYSFIWLGELPLFPLTNVYVKDYFKDQRGGCHVKLTSLYEIANISGGICNEACLVRYLNEIVLLCPGILAIDKRLEYKVDKENPRLVEIFIKSGETTASEQVLFEENGSIKLCWANRYCEDAKRKLKWETVFYPKTVKLKNGTEIQYSGTGAYFRPILDENKKETGKMENRVYIEVFFNNITYDERTVL